MKAIEWITTEAKKLRQKYPKRFKTWREYVAQASAIYSSKHKGKSPVSKKKIGSIKIIEKNESKTAKPKAIYQINRSKKGTYKSVKKIGAVNKGKINHPGIERAATELAYSMPNHTKPDKYGNFSEKQIENAIKKYSPGLYQASKYGMKDEIIARVKEIINKRVKKIGFVKPSTHKDTKSHNVNIRIVSGIQKTIAGMQKKFVAIYQNKSEIVHMDIFNASSLQEARKYAQTHKKNTPELRKYKSIKTTVKLKK